MAQPEGKLEPLADSVPCPCNTGKTHGDCCARSEGTRWMLFSFPDGRTAHMQIGKVTTSLLRTVAPPYPEFLIRVVGLSLQAAAQTDAGEYEGLMALLATATALEAVVNRLLEPIVQAEKWQKIEQKPHETKWHMLYEKLKIKPGLNKDRQPLLGFKELIAARNRLIHYKHGEHVETFELPTPSSWKLGTEGGELDVQLPRKLPDLPESVVRALMAPGKAADYAYTLVAMAAPVLDAHPSDPFGVVDNLAVEIARLKAAIGATRLPAVAAQPAAVAPLSVLRGGWRQRAAVILQVASAIAGLTAAVLWYFSTTGALPPPRTYWDAAPLSDPFYMAVAESAEWSRIAAILTVVSVLMSIPAWLMKSPSRASSSTAVRPGP